MRELCSLLAAAHWEISPEKCPLPTRCTTVTNATFHQLEVIVEYAGQRIFRAWPLSSPLAINIAEILAACVGLSIAVNELLIPLEP